jgi:hypothetical protein
LDELPNSSCYWALPVELLTAGVVMLAVWPGHLAFAGVVVDVSSNVSSGAIVDSCRPSICVAVAPAALCSGCRQQLVTPLLSLINRGLLPLPLAFATLLTCSFSCCDDAMHWTLIFHLSRRLVTWRDLQYSHLPS